MAEHRCPAWVRVLPRVLAGSLMAAGLIAGWGLPAGAHPWIAAVRGLMAVVGAALAFAVLRGAPELRGRFTLAEDAVRLDYGAKPLLLPLVRLARLDVAPPLGRPRLWAPAVELIDEEERAWRLPIALSDGEAFLDRLAERAGRDDLRAWIEARGLRRWMRRGRLWAAAIYLVSAGLLAAAAAFGLRG